MLITKNTLAEMIEEDWGGDIVSNICLELMDYLIGLQYLVEPMPFGFFCIVTNHKYKIGDLILAIQYLCGDRVNLLSLRFREESEEGGVKFTLNPNYDNCDKDKVFLHFLPSETCERVKNMPNFTSSSVRNGDYEYWQTGIESLAEGIDRDSLLGETLGLAMSCCRGDRVIYTLNKVN